MPKHFGDSQDGSFLSRTLADYLWPAGCEVGRASIAHRERPCRSTLLGSKEIGEGHCKRKPGCIANAVTGAAGARNVKLAHETRMKWLASDRMA